MLCRTCCMRTRPGCAERHVRCFRHRGGKKSKTERTYFDDEEDRRKEVAQQRLEEQEERYKEAYNQLRYTTNKVNRPRPGVHEPAILGELALAAVSLRLRGALSSSALQRVF